MIFWYDSYGGNSAWYNWGRWVLLGVVIAVAIIAFLFVRWHAMIQVRRGQQPTTGTAWMVPPSYYQSQQQHYSEAAPPYNPDVSHADAGYYDEHGNFIAKEEFQPPYDAEQRAGEHSTPPNPTTHNADNVGPPEGPPPGRDPVDSSAAPAPSQAAVSDYYPPPDPPTPAKR